MKKIFTLTLVAFMCVPCSSFAKKAKEKKMNKKEMKAEISNLDSSMNALKQQVAQLDSAKSTLQASLDEAHKDNQDAQTALSSAKSELEGLRKMAADKEEAEKSAKAAPGGLAFKVQVGAYKKFDISAYFEQPKNMTTEDIDGYKKYLVGYFGEQEKAENFVKDMKKMGVKDAWLVPYKDGARISDEEAGQILGHPLRGVK